MRSFLQPERTRNLPINEAERPEPWAMPARRDYEPDGSGWHDPSGIRVFVALNDQHRAPIDLSNRQLISLAAAQINGAGAFYSEGHEYIGAEAVRQNTHLRKNNMASDTVSTVVVSGASYHEITAAVVQMYEQTLLIHGVAEPEIKTSETIIFHT